MMMSPPQDRAAIYALSSRFDNGGSPPVDRRATRTRTHLACRSKSEGELENDRALSSTATPWPTYAQACNLRRRCKTRIWGRNVDDSLDLANLEPIAE